MKKIQNIILISMMAAFGYAIISCDKIKDPYLGIGNGGDTTSGDTSIILNADSIWGDTGNTTVRKMMIEEITGQTCGNCPPKTKLIVDWVDSIYKHKVYSVAFHATAFASPTPKFKDDHRTAKGTNFNNNLGNVDAPVAIFNRLDLNGSGLIVQGGKFQIEFNKLVGSGALTNPKAQIQILNILDKDSLKNRLIISVKALENLIGIHTLILYVIEDPVIGDQKYYFNPNGPENIFDTYAHRHMFRDAIGSLDGNTIVSSELLKGESVSKTFNYKIDTDKWNIKNCRFIAAIRNNKTGEIIQLDEVHASN